MYVVYICSHIYTLCCATKTEYSKGHKAGASIQQLQKQQALLQRGIYLFDNTTILLGN